MKDEENAVGRRLSLKAVVASIAVIFVALWASIYLVFDTDFLPGFVTRGDVQVIDLDSYARNMSQFFHSRQLDIERFGADTGQYPNTLEDCANRYSIPLMLIKNDFAKAKTTKKWIKVRAWTDMLGFPVGRYYLSGLSFRPQYSLYTTEAPPKTQKDAIKPYPNEVGLSESPGNYGYFPAISGTGKRIAYVFVVYDLYNGPKARKIGDVLVKPGDLAKPGESLTWTDGSSSPITLNQVFMWCKGHL